MPADEQAPKLRSDLVLRQRTLWLGEMELYEDHLSISGWRWTGSVHRPIRFENIQQVEKWAVPRGVNLVIRHQETQDFHCRVLEQVYFWVKALREEERTEVELRP
jgi:hypothetical protein